MRGFGPSSAFGQFLRVTAVLFFIHAARAEPDAAQIATARRLFTEAAELRSAGNWSEAASKLKDAIAIKETAGLRFHLAHCEEKLGHLVLAERDYDRADELIRAGAKAPDVETLLATARADLRERVPSLLVKIPPDVPDVSVSVDGSSVEAATLGAPLPLDPGSHEVAAHAEGRTPFRLEVQLTEGEDRVVDVALPSLAPTRASAPPQTPRLRHADAGVDSPSSPFGAREIVLIGEGALALGGVAVGVVFLVKRGRADRHVTALDGALGQGNTGACLKPTDPATAAQCSDFQAALDERRRDGNIAAAGFIGAGVGVAAAAVTWLLWPKPHREHALVLLPLAGGAALRGAF
jgi:hypothetical protein